MAARRAVITGLGILAPNGNGKDQYWDSLVHGKSGIRRITFFDPSFLTSQIAGEVKAFDPCDYFDPKLVKRTARYTHFAISAAKMALADSGIDLRKENENRYGVCFGTTVGAENDIYERQHKKFLQAGPGAVSRLTAPELTPHVTTGYICSALKITGPNSTLSSGCTTGLDVVNYGHKMIKRGEVDVIIVGSSDAPILPFPMSTLCTLGILSKRNDRPEEASRPYDKDRDGMVLSEGGAAIIIEELNHALDRDANIYAEVLSFASTSEAQEVVQSDTSGEALVSALEQALIAARIIKEEVDYICAHGNAIPSYDIAETNAFKTFFKDRAYKIPVSSVKSMTGQSFAAGGGFQTVATCLSLKNGIIPPTINLDTPDPLCDLDYVPNYARYCTIDTALINGHSVGGTHAVLILKRYQ